MLERILKAKVSAVAIGLLLALLTVSNATAQGRNGQKGDVVREGRVCSSTKVGPSTSETCIIKDWDTGKVRTETKNCVGTGIGAGGKVGGIGLGAETKAETCTTIREPREPRN